MPRCAPIPHVALACLATLAACRAREPRAPDTTASRPAATPAAGDSLRARDSARVAAGGAGEEDRPCLASRIGLPCAGSDGPP